MGYFALKCCKRKALFVAAISLLDFVGDFFEYRDATLQVYRDGKLFDLGASRCNSGHPIPRCDAEANTLVVHLESKQAVI